MSKEITNNNFILIGTDTAGVERQKVSNGIGNFLSEKIHANNPQAICDYIRETFFKFEPGKKYKEYSNLPVTMFYCPTHLRKLSVNIKEFTAWGICGAHTAPGRSSNYTHSWIDTYDAVLGAAYYAKIFGCKFLAEDDIIKCVDDTFKYKPKIEHEVSPVGIPNLSDQRDNICKIAEELKKDKIVVVRLRRDTTDFNVSAKNIIIQALALLPPRLRRDIGFITYVSRARIDAFSDKLQSNIRLILVDSDVEVGDLYRNASFSVIDMEATETASKDMLLWSTCPFDEREQQVNLYEANTSPLPSSRDELDALISEYKAGTEYAAELKEKGLPKVTNLTELVTLHHNQQLCRTVPVAKEAFVKNIPSALSDLCPNISESERLPMLMLELIENNYQTLLEYLNKENDKAKSVMGTLLYCGTAFLSTSDWILPVITEIAASHKNEAKRQSEYYEPIIKNKQVAFDAEKAAKEDAIAKYNAEATDNMKLKSENSELQQNLGISSDNLARAMENIQKLRASESNLIQKLDETNAKLNTAESQLLTERGARDAAETRLKSAVENYKRLVEEKESLARKISEKDSEISNINAHKNVLAEELETVKSENATHKDLITALKRKVVDREDAIIGGVPLIDIMKKRKDLLIGGIAIVALVLICLIGWIVTGIGKANAHKEFIEQIAELESTITNIGATDTQDVTIDNSENTANTEKVIDTNDQHDTEPVETSDIQVTDTTSDDSSNAESVDSEDTSSPEIEGTDTANSDSTSENDTEDNGDTETTIESDTAMVG